MEDLISEVAQGIMVVCAKLSYCIQPSDVEVPLVDSMLIHSKTTVEFS